MSSVNSIEVRISTNMTGVYENHDETHFSNTTLLQANNVGTVLASQAQKSSSSSSGSSSSSSSSSCSSNRVGSSSLGVVKTRQRRQPVYTRPRPPRVPIRPPPPPTARVGNASRAMFLFEKRLKHSDVSAAGRIVIPKTKAETNLPLLSNDKDGIWIFMDDMDHLPIWTFRYRCWPNNSSRMYVLENAKDFITQYQLTEGDSVMFCKDFVTDTYLIRAQKLRRKDKNEEIIPLEITGPIIEQQPALISNNNNTPNTPLNLDFLNLNVNCVVNNTQSLDNNGSISNEDAALFDFSEFEFDFSLLRTHFPDIF